MNRELVWVRAALRGWQAGIWTALPGIVQSFDAEKCTVEVQPAVQAQTQDKNQNWQNVNLPVLPDVPVLFFGTAAFALTLPVAAGDEGLLVFGSRCIDAWWQQGGVQPQAENRMHDLSDAFFIPAPMSQQKKFSDISTTEPQLRRANGEVLLALTETGARVKGNLAVEGSLSVTGNMQIDGEITGEGGGAAPVTFAGPVRSKGDVVAGYETGGAVSTQNHVHGGVQPGAGSTNPPTPS